MAAGGGRGPTPAWGGSLQDSVCACRRRGNGDAALQAASQDDEVFIPLKEVVRFKERQWFLEELEVRLAGR